MRSAPFARFDDLRAGRRMLFGPADAEALVASEPGDVLPVLRTVEEATRAGMWAAGFVSYEAAAGLGSPLPVRAALPAQPCGELPLAWFGLFAAPSPGEPLEAPGPATPYRGYTAEPWQPDWTAEGYAHRVDAVRERIAAGDTYQCNLTVRLRSRVGGDLLDLYRDLALAQRGAYNAYVDTGRFVVVSASPELFFDWRGNRLTTRPMKGTVPRGRWPAEDAERAARLLSSAKDRAENVMIVDLLRNDLGKVAEWGTVEVPALFELERYETLWQLTSTVAARTRPETTLVDVFEALFPCGSVTGAPKRSSMALITRLESSSRGAYCGAVGFLGPPRSGPRALFNVAIRTVMVDRATGDAVYGTGGGVTWGSSADAEHAELLAKAAILVAPPEDFQLLETIGYRPGQGFGNLERHLGRLGSSADYFGFRFDPEEARAALSEATASAEAPRRVRLTLSRSGAVEAEATPMPTRAWPVVLTVDPEPVDSSEVWLYHKTTRRCAYEARASRHPDVDDIVLLNERGEVTETTIANLAVRSGGRWWTPPVEAGCLPGVERARLVEEGRLTERRLTVEDLRGAQAVALVSSLRGWRPAMVSAGGELRRSLQSVRLPPASGGMDGR